MATKIEATNMNNDGKVKGTKKGAGKRAEFDIGGLFKSTNMADFVSEGFKGHQSAAKFCLSYAATLKRPVYAKLADGEATMDYKSEHVELTTIPGTPISRTVKAPLSFILESDLIRELNPTTGGYQSEKSGVHVYNDAEAKAALAAMLEGREPESIGTTDEDEAEMDESDAESDADSASV